MVMEKAKKDALTCFFPNAQEAGDELPTASLSLPSAFNDATRMLPCYTLLMSMPCKI